MKTVFEYAAIAMVCERWSPRTKNVGKLEIYTLQSTKKKKKEKPLANRFPAIFTTVALLVYTLQTVVGTCILSGQQKVNRARRYFQFIFTLTPRVEGMQISYEDCSLSGKEQKNRKTRTEKNCSYVNLAPRVLRLSG